MRPNLLSLYFFVSAATATAAAAASVKPNVLMLLVDDLKPALGAYGDLTVPTPHMDGLCQRGIRFEKAYCNIAVCAPSRYNLMTGVRSTTLGIYGFGKDFRSVYPNAVTLPQHFMQHGYTAESLGKVYHFGHGTLLDDASWSEPHFKEKVVEYLDPASTDGKLTREEALFGNISVPKEQKPLPRGAAWESPDVPDDAYADGRVAAEACKRLAAMKERLAKGGKPFFMAVGFARPHLPFSVPKKYWDAIDTNKLPMPTPEMEKDPEGSPNFVAKRGGEIDQYKPVPQNAGGKPYPEEIKRKLIHGYYAGVSYVDVQIGRVLQGLREHGLEENTVVVLWGDHGYFLGEMNTWTKHTNFELANRIPLVFAGPGITRKGQATAQLAETVDVYPTLASLAGLPVATGPQPREGLDLSPVMQQEGKPLKEHVFHCYPRGEWFGRAVRTATHRLVEWRKRETTAESPVQVELYEYSSGNIEKRNIAAEQPEMVKKLQGVLDKETPKKQAK